MKWFKNTFGRQKLIFTKFKLMVLHEFQSYSTLQNHIHDENQNMKYDPKWSKRPVLSLNRLLILNIIRNFFISRTILFNSTTKIVHVHWVKEHGRWLFDPIVSMNRFWQVATVESDDLLVALMVSKRSLIPLSMFWRPMIKNIIHTIIKYSNEIL